MPERMILLMCDYSADPVWWGSDGSVMAELSELPLRKQTKVELRAWAERFEEGENAPWAHKWPSDEARIEFDHEGRRLWAVVQEDLGPDWVVGYFSEVDGRRYWPDDESGDSGLSV